MDYSEFFQKFGGSARAKNIAFPGEPEFDQKRGVKRRFALPQKSGLPKDFIRLCPWEMEYLFLVARRARVGIVETGRFNGGSCFVMAGAAPDVPLHSIDIAPQNDDRLRSLFLEHDVGRKVDLIVGDSQKAKYEQINAIDVLYIDGDHSYNGCMNDILNWYGHLLPNGHLILHDAYLGTHGVQDALIDFLSEHPELQVIQSPFIGASYWHYPAGSMAHFIKRA
jgi:predicted O-methyltransferase YrrM